MEIASHIYSLYAPINKGYFLSKYPPNVYLILDGEGVLIDSGYGYKDGVKRRLDYLEELGKPKVEYIVLTHGHPDHMGGAEKIKKATGAKIMIHERDAKVASRTLKEAGIDETFHGGEVLRVGNIELEMMHTPGHTSGHICVMKRDDRSLFTGDHILGSGTTAIDPKDGDMSVYVESLKLLQGIDIKTIYPGHGQPIKEPQRKIRKLIEHRVRREEQILTYLGRGMNTIDAMFPVMYPELDKDLWRDARGQIEVHLIKLRKEGRVLSKDGGKSYSLR